MVSRRAGLCQGRRWAGDGGRATVGVRAGEGHPGGVGGVLPGSFRSTGAGPRGALRVSSTTAATVPATSTAPTTMRSEEHTSELQSRGHLVCRLLLEKKKTRQYHTRRYQQQ